MTNDQKAILALTGENERLRARLAEAEAQNSVLWDAANDRNQRLDHAEALLLETCERMSEAETTSRVLTGQLPEYSEGQQMLRSLAAKMGDSVKRIRAFLAPDSASGDEGWGKVCAHCGRRYTRSLAQCPWIGCQTNADRP